MQKLNWRFRSAKERISLDWNLGLLTWWALSVLAHIGLKRSRSALWKHMSYTAKTAWVWKCQRSCLSTGSDDLGTPRSGHKPRNDRCEEAGCCHISNILNLSLYRQLYYVSRLNLLHGLCSAIWGVPQRFYCFWDLVRILWFVPWANYLCHLTFIL